MGSDNSKKEQETKDEYFSFKSIHKYIGIEDPILFKNYLHNVFIDISSFDEKLNKKYINKIVFYDYMKLPIFISEKLFCSFDSDNDNKIEENEFVLNLYKLYCGTFYETSEIIFKLLDFDKDGIIQKDDVIITLSFLPLNQSGESFEENQIKSRKEINEIINYTFSKYDNELNFEKFVDAVINKKSDVYLQLICFLYQMRTFSEENLILMKDNNFDYEDEYNNLGRKIIEEKDNIKLKVPNRKSSLQPAEEFLKSNSFNSEKEDLIKEINKKNNLYNSVDMVRLSNENILSNSFDKNDKASLKEYMSHSRKTYNSPSKYLLEQQRIRPISGRFKYNNKILIPINEEKENEIHDDIISNNNTSVGSENNININNNNNNNQSNYENWIFKKSNEDNKFNKFYLVLYNKDIYYYKDENKNNLIGMHHLSGCLIKEPSEDEIIEFENVKYYSFSIIFYNKSKTRIYYSPSLEIINIFSEKLKQAIGYLKFNDYYEIKNMIGKGKFGIVHLGIHKKTNEKVAIKIINKSSLKTPDDKVLIRSEIDIMKLCHHPNIIRLLDHFENSEYIFIVMEYISGGTLTQFLKKRYFNFSESQAANIINQIGQGLKYLHSYGIVHRDLKTENIMMTQLNDNGIIKIMDFGLSKIVGPKEGLIDGYGTLNYVAPEVLLREPYNKEIDIWSLGIILYLFLCGHVPFFGNKQDIIAKKIVYDDVDFDEDEWEMRSRKVIDLIEKCLEKDPKKRIDIDQFLMHPWFKKNHKQKLSL